MSPDGFNAGHGGIKITAEDLAKVGQLYMNGGVWNGKQILSKEWCDLAIGYEKRWRIRATTLITGLPTKTACITPPPVPTARRLPSARS